MCPWILLGGGESRCDTGFCQRDGRTDVTVWCPPSEGTDRCNGLFFFPGGKERERKKVVDSLWMEQGRRGVRSARAGSKKKKEKIRDIRSFLSSEDKKKKGKP